MPLRKKELFLSKSVSGHFKTKKKVPMATKQRGGGGLSGRAPLITFAMTFNTKFSKKNHLQMLYVCIMLTAKLRFAMSLKNHVYIFSPLYNVIYEYIFSSSSPTISCHGQDNYTYHYT